MHSTDLEVEFPKCVLLVKIHWVKKTCIWNVSKWTSLKHVKRCAWPMKKNMLGCHEWLPGGCYVVVLDGCHVLVFRCCSAPSFTVYCRFLIIYVHRKNSAEHVMYLVFLVEEFNKFLSSQSFKLGATLNMRYKYFINLFIKLLFILYVV